MGIELSHGGGTEIPSLAAYGRSDSAADHPCEGAVETTFAGTLQTPGDADPPRDGKRDCGGTPLAPTDTG
jgi:hypothetical protein